jgi:hypothetical protein
LCSDHYHKGRSDGVTHLTETDGVSRNNDHCAIDPERGVVPSKQSTIEASIVIGALTFLKPTRRAKAGFNPTALMHLPLSTADPPLERLCVFRI